MAADGPAPFPLRVSPYARISDTDEERAPGIDRQLRVVLPLIAARGAAATGEYVDNDKSAYKADVIRDEGFEPWLQDFIDNKTDGIAAFDLDRLFRQTTDLNRVIKAYCDAYFKEGRPKPVLWLPSGSIDLTDEDGQMMATVLVAMAKNSSGKTAKRITTFYRDEALKGRIYTSYPAFYRNQDGSINPAKKAIALKAVADVFAGVSATAIAAEWRGAGITTARGGRATNSTVRRILTSPGMAGLAVYKRDILLDDDGQPIRRSDGGIIDEGTWHSLCAKLQTTPGLRRRPTKGLLSKKARCGLCGSGMSSFRRSDTFFTYACRTVDSGGCSGVAISGPQLNRQITDMVLEYLRRPLPVVADESFAGTARLEEVSAMIAELMTEYRRGDLSGAVVFPEVKKLEDEKRTLQAEAAKHARSRQQITTAAEEWPTLGLERQQAIIDKLFEAIVIMPARNRRPGVYDPDRVQVIWRLQIDPGSIRALLSQAPGRSPHQLS